MTDIDPWDLIDPSARLTEIAKRVPFSMPCTVLGLVIAGTDQRVTAATKLWASPPLDTAVRTEVTEAAIERLGCARYGWREDYRDRPIVVPVVVIDGPCWWSIDVDEVLLGLRYANNCFQLPTSNPYVVNRHGWYDAFDERAGTTPAARFTRLSVA